MKNICLKVAFHCVFFTCLFWVLSCWFFLSVCSQGRKFHCYFLPIHCFSLVLGILSFLSKCYRALERRMQWCGLRVSFSAAHLVLISVLYHRFGTATHTWSYTLTCQCPHLHIGKTDFICPGNSSQWLFYNFHSYLEFYPFLRQRNVNHYEFCHIRKSNIWENIFPGFYFFNACS